MVFLFGALDTDTGAQQGGHLGKLREIRDRAERLKAKGEDVSEVEKLYPAVLRAARKPDVSEIERLVEKARTILDKIEKSAGNERPGMQSPAPRVLSVSPAPYLPGRTLFTIRGQGFQKGATVVISCESYPGIRLSPAQTNVVSQGEIRASLLAGPGTSGVEHGPGPEGAAFRVLNPDGGASAGFRIPSRPVTLHVVFHTHLDIGYNGAPSEVAKRYKDFLDKVVKMIVEDRWEHDDGKVRFAVETLWQLEQFINRSTPAQVEKFFELVRGGKIEVCAGYDSPNTSAIGCEHLSRLFYPAARFREKYGIRIATLIYNDQPGYTWGLADVAARSGIRYFLSGINLFKGKSIPGNPFPLRLTPCRWTGRTGDSVLMWPSIGEQDRGKRPWDKKLYKCINRGAYMNAADFGLVFLPNRMNRYVGEKYRNDRLESRVLEALGYFADRDYAHGDILLMGSNGDNNWRGGKGEDPFRLFYWMTEAARRLNAKKNGLRIRISTPTPFFEMMEKKHGPFPRFPGPGAGHGGDWPSSWEAADGSAMRCSSLIRVARKSGPASEKIASANLLLGSNDPYPASGLQELWRLVRVWDGHTSPGNTVNNENEGALTWEEALKHDEEYVELSKHAEALGRRLVSEEIGKLGAFLAHEKKIRVVVFNPSGWTRTDTVSVKTPDGGPFEIKDLETGKPVPLQRSHGEPERVAFLAQDVPPCGYRTYEMLRPESPREHGEAALAVLTKERRIENGFYRITLGRDGHPVEIIDKTLGRDLIDHKARFRFLHLTGINSVAAKANGFKLGSFMHHEPKQAVTRIFAQRSGPVGAALVVERAGAQVRTEIRLFEGVKRIDFVLTINPNALEHVPFKRTYQTVWCIPFPLALDAAKLALRLDTSSGFLDPFTDRIPGTFNDLMYAVDGIAACDGAACVDLGCAENFVWDLPTTDGLIGMVSGKANGLERPRVSTLLSLFFQSKRPRLVTFKRGPEDRPGDGDPDKPGYQAYPVKEPGLTGPLTLSYSLSSRGGGRFSAVESARFLTGINNPMLTFVVRPGASPEKKQTRMPPCASFIKINPPNVEVTAFKRARNGNGYIVRMREIAGSMGKAVIASDLFRIGAAERANLVEDPDKNLGKAKAADGTAAFDIRAFETAAVRIGSLERK